MPKVLRIINRFNLGGPTYNVAYLSKYMEPQYQTILVGGEKDESEDSSQFVLDKLGLNPIIIQEMKREIDIKNDRIAYLKIRQLIREHKPDIVHTHASKAGTIGRLAARAENVPVIVHTFHGHVFHSYFGKLKTLFYKNIERFLALISTRIIAISEIQKIELSEIHKITSKNKIEIIPLGFDLNKFQENTLEKRNLFREKYKLNQETVAIGIIGRLVPVKNHELFLNAISFLQQTSKIKFKAFIIGDGELRKQLENSAKEKQLEFETPEKENQNAILVFTSWIKEVDFALSGLDIVALTSFNEGTPVSLIEAQAAGKPIVSTNVGGIENVVIKNKTALLSEIDKPESFFSNLKTLTEDYKLRQEMSALGWQHVFEKFHYNRLVKDMQNLYEKLLVKKK
jgi:glycosyltransferase involved in cell wall biosynthesis